MLLESGSTGDDVKQLQKQLGLVADGVFGDGTKAAVKAWKEINELYTSVVNDVKVFDGIVSDAAWFILTSTPASPASANDPASLDLSKLQGQIPDAVFNQLADCVSKFQINTPLRVAHFLAQCAHESGGFTVTQENLNYSAGGLRKVFGKYFTDDGIANAYANQPQKIAARIYGGRMGNGDEASGDGWKYHGRGYIQLTGKDNYTKFSKDAGVDCVNDPDSVAITYALLSAAWFWNSNSLNKIDFSDTNENAVVGVTRIVNGGYNGLKERTDFFKTFYQLLT
ncbi:MAG: glycoside hydrolase family 19 protein [Gallionella sp.]|nr:glycoside hydrolase family 19 protein [Gallionella sp.]